MLTLTQRQNIKAIPITSYLASKKIFPVIETGGEYCYFSPFRDERSPSFFVNPAKNVYMDFADGNGGDGIKLAMQLDQADFNNAVQILQSVDPEIAIHFNEDFPASPQYQSFIKRITPVRHPALINYLTRTRKILSTRARQELSEIHYYTSKGEFFSLGFKNESDGWELRNPSFKGCIGQKDISIRGNRCGKFAYVFEGFMDYLSFLMLFNDRGKNLKNNCCFYILNSLSLLNRLPDLERFEIVFVALDNDAEGKKAALKICQIYPKAFNYSHQLFPSHKDFNNYLTLTT